VELEGRTRGEDSQLFLVTSTTRENYVRRRQKGGGTRKKGGGGGALDKKCVGTWGRGSVKEQRAPRGKKLKFLLVVVEGDILAPVRIPANYNKSKGGKGEGEMGLGGKKKNEL